MTRNIPREKLEQWRDALEIGRDAAYEVAQDYHAAMAGYRQSEHGRLDDEHAKTVAALSSIEAELEQPQGEQSTAPESPQAAAQSTALEPVANCWETSQGVFHNFSPMRDAAVSEAACKRMRQTFHLLYATPSAAMALLGEARDQIDTLCNGLEWNIENHPDVMNDSDSEALEGAREFIARIDALTGTGRKEQSNG